MGKIFTLYITWDPALELVPWKIPLLNRPILWYGFFFALGFFLAYLVFQHLIKNFLKPYRVSKKEALLLSERAVFYIVIGTLLGARFGDVIFYQSLKQYVHDPLGVFRFWEGGLSSHGGIVGLFLAIGIFAFRTQKKYKMLTWIAMLDLLAIPGLLAGGFIRIGNFFNQEILGIPATVPWAIIFVHPADGSLVLPRHPVQLYEAFFYFGFFSILWLIRTKIPKMIQRGKTSGLCLIGVFVFRFFVEFFKVRQSILIDRHAFLSMGQMLSLPLIVFGLLLFFLPDKRSHVRKIKRH